MLNPGLAVAVRHRRQAQDDGAWVREAAAAYAIKQQAKLALASGKAA